MVDVALLNQSPQHHLNTRLNEDLMSIYSKVFIVCTFLHSQIQISNMGFRVIALAAV